MITSELDDAVIDEDENRSPIGLSTKEPIRMFLYTHVTIV